MLYTSTGRQAAHHRIGKNVAHQSAAVALQYAWFRGRMRQARQVSLSLYELRVQHTDCSATEQTTTEQIALVAIS